MLLTAICTWTRMYVLTKTLVKNFLKKKKTTLSIKSIHDLEYCFSDNMLWLDIKVQIVCQKYLRRCKRTTDNGRDDTRQRMPTHSNRSPGWLRFPKTTPVGPTNSLKHFCSETPVWELVVTPQLVSVFILLTKWNCSNCRLKNFFKCIIKAKNGES